MSVSLRAKVNLYVVVMAAIYIKYLTCKAHFLNPVVIPNKNELAFALDCFFKYTIHTYVFRTISKLFRTFSNIK